jgi:hypothetical protein
VESRSAGWLGTIGETLLAEAETGPWIEMSTNPTTENPVVNYHAVRWYLSQNEVSSLPEISLVYTGEVNEYYIMLLDEAFTRLHVGGTGSVL